jgi:transcriptional regulator with XRE-family HTH domain
MVHVEERTRLIAAREILGFSQAELGEKIHYSKEAISSWELGLRTPSKEAILKLCEFFGKNPADLDLANELSQDELEMIQEILKNRTVDRRQALAIVATPAFANVDLSSLSKPLVSYGATENLCRAAIQGCWSLLDSNLTEASTILKESEGVLSELATRSKYQRGAATLAVEVKIIQMAIATRRGDYSVREQLGLDALDIAEMSGDGDIHAMVLGWHGDTYKYCLFQPKTAQAILKDALKCGEISPLNKASTYSDLALAYALDRNQKKARDYIQLAQMVMPDHPEQDSLYRCIRTGQSEIDQRVGRVYLILAAYFPKEKYAQMAYETALESLSKPSLSLSHRAEILIQKADAARGTKNFDEFVKGLKEGIPIAFQTDSKIDQDRARKVLGNAPDAWKSEQQYQDLVKMF